MTEIIDSNNQELGVDVHFVEDECQHVKALKAGFFKYITKPFNVV
jgi:DNA-binding response OmpR family regulator